MKKVLLMVCIALSVVVNAQQLELDLDNPNALNDLEDVLHVIETYDDGYSLFDTGNGEYYIVDFDLSTFDLSTEQGKLQADYPNDGDVYGDCTHEDMEPVKTLGPIKIMESNASNSDALEVLERLEQTGMVSVVLSRAWDGMSGDSEYCLREAYRVYLKNGKVLHINYDHTD